MPKLLVVTGDPSVHDAMRCAVASPGAGIEVLAAWNAGDGWRRTRCDGPDALVIDLDLPDGSGLELFDRVRVADPKLLTVFVTTECTADAAVEAMTRGAFDYLLRPLTRRQVSRRLGAALRAASLMRTPVLLPHAPAGVWGGTHTRAGPGARVHVGWPECVGRGDEVGLSTAGTRQRG